MEPIRLPQIFEMEPNNSSKRPTYTTAHDPFSDDQSLLNKHTQPFHQGHEKPRIPHSLRITLRIISLLLTKIGTIIHTLPIYLKDPNISWTYPHNFKL
jgi:hypothetical protein